MTEGADIGRWVQNRETVVRQLCMDKALYAVAYYRVSTAAQGRSGLGLSAQSAAVAEVARARGLSVLAEFTEVESGGRNDRIELGKALHHAKVTGAVLVIAKLDRLSRNAAFLLTLRDSGVRFLAADIPDANDITIGVLAVIAQAEREAISQRTKSALAVVRERLKGGEAHVSRRSGQPISRLGNPNGAEPIRRAAKGSVAALAEIRTRANNHAKDLEPVIYRLQREGIVSLGQLAQALNAANMRTRRGGRWHASTVRNILARL